VIPSKAAAMLQRLIDEVVSTKSGIAWSISIRDASGRALAARHADRCLHTASVGKLLLLIETARQCADGELVGTALLRRDPDLAVADSGIWQHLRAEELAVEDLCVLIASVSDNIATNVLLKQVGVQRLQTLAASLGLVHTAMLDYIRDRRGPDDPVTVSTGSASELSRVMSQLSDNTLISVKVSEQVNSWLSTGVDLSMVASGLGLDPLAHAASGRDLFVRNKTGSDPGVRADVGTVGCAAARLSYAVIANWDASTRDVRDAVLAGMNEVGTAMKTIVASAGMGTA
jgi:beta-lactamase class A